MLNWYLQNGKDSDVVVSSRIRLARNFNNIPFELKYTGGLFTKTKKSSILIVW